MEQLQLAYIKETHLYQTNEEVQPLLKGLDVYSVHLLRPGVKTFIASSVPSCEALEVGVYFHVIDEGKHDPDLEVIAELEEWFREGRDPIVTGYVYFNWYTVQGWANLKRTVTDPYQVKPQPHWNGVFRFDVPNSVIQAHMEYDDASKIDLDESPLHEMWFALFEEGECYYDFIDV